MTLSFHLTQPSATAKWVTSAGCHFHNEKSHSASVTCKGWVDPARLVTRAAVLQGFVRPISRWRSGCVPRMSSRELSNGTTRRRTIWPSHASFREASSTTVATQFGSLIHNVHGVEDTVPIGNASRKAAAEGAGFRWTFRGCSPRNRRGRHGHDAPSRPV